MPIDKKNLKPKPEEEGLAHKAFRVYNTPAVDLVPGGREKVEKLTAPTKSDSTIAKTQGTTRNPQGRKITVYRNARDVGQQESVNKHPILGRMVMAALNGGVPLTDAEKKGLVAGATEAITPALVAQAATLGHSKLATVANAAITAEGGKEALDTELPWWKRALGAGQVVMGGAGMLGQAKRAAQGWAAATPQGGLTTIQQALKDYEAFRLGGGAESAMETKFPQLYKEIKANPGGEVAKAVYGGKGAPGPLAIEEKLARKVAETKHAASAERTAADMNAKEAAVDIDAKAKAAAEAQKAKDAEIKKINDQLKANADANKGLNKAQATTEKVVGKAQDAAKAEDVKRAETQVAQAAAERKAVEDELNKGFTEAEKDARTRAANTKKEQAGQAQEGAQQTKNEEARQKFEEARAQQEKLDKLKTGENVEETEGPVKETSKGKGPSGESQSQTKTYREKPPEEEGGGEGEGVVPEEPKGPTPIKDWKQQRFFSLKEAKDYAKKMGHNPDTVDFVTDAQKNVTAVPKGTPKPGVPVTPEKAKALGLPENMTPEGPVKEAAPAETAKAAEEPPKGPETPPEASSPTPKGKGPKKPSGGSNGSGGGPKGNGNGGGPAAPPAAPIVKVPKTPKNGGNGGTAVAEAPAEALPPGLEGVVSGSPAEVPIAEPAPAIPAKKVPKVKPQGRAKVEGNKVEKFAAQGEDPLMEALVEKMAGGADKPAPAKTFLDQMSPSPDTSAPVGATKLNGKAAKMTDLGDSEKVLDDLMTRKYGPEGRSNVNPEGQGTLPAEPPDEGAIVQNTQPAPTGETTPPTFRMAEPEMTAEELAKLKDTGEAYGSAKAAKKAGTGTEEARAEAARAAQEATQGALAKGGPNSDQFSQLPPEQTEPLLAQLVKRWKAQNSSGGGIKFGPETGAAAIPLTLRMGTGALGAIAGSQYDKDHPLTGAAIGGTAGFLGPSMVSAALPAIEGQVPTMVKGAQTGMDWLNRIHNSMLLSPYSVAKKAAGDVQALVTAGVIRPDRAGDLLRQVTTPEGLSLFGKNFREGMINPESPGAAGLENFVNQAWNPMSWAGKTMGGLTKATKGALGQAGFTVPEQGELTMTAEPTSRLGRAVYNATRGSRIAQHFEPFMRMGVNRLERGIDYSPLGLFNPKIAEPGQFIPRATKAAVGTLAGVGAYNAVPDDFVKKHPIGAGMLAAGPMGIPIMTGMALKTAKGNNEKGGEAFLKNTARAAQAIEHDIPGFQLLQNLDRPEGTVRNYLSGYTNALHPITEGIKAFKGDTSEADVSSRKLDLQGRLINRMLSNIPGVEATLPRKSSNPFGNVDLTGGSPSPIFQQ